MNNSDSIDALIEQGVGALENEDFDTAIACFREVLRQAPFRNDVRQLLAYALDRQVQVGKSTSVPLRQDEVLRQKTPSEKTDSLTPESVRKRPILWSCLLSLFVVLCVIGAVVFIIFKEPILGWVKTNLPAQVPLVTPEEKEALALYDTALQYFRQHRYDEAESTLKKALELNPPGREKIKALLAKVYNAQGDDFYDKGKYLSAAQAYEKAVSYNPQEVEYTYNAGWAYYRYGYKCQIDKKPATQYFEKAEQFFNKTLEIDNGFLRAYQGLARVYIRLNRPSSAARMYKKIIEIAPESYEAELARHQLKNMFGENIP